MGLQGPKKNTVSPETARRSPLDGACPATNELASSATAVTKTASAEYLYRGFISQTLLDCPPSCPAVSPGDSPDFEARRCHSTPAESGIATTVPGPRPCSP